MTAAYLAVLAAALVVEAGRFVVNTILRYATRELANQMRAEAIVAMAPRFAEAAEAMRQLADAAAAYVAAFRAASKEMVN